MADTPLDCRRRIGCNRFGEFKVEVFPLWNSGPRDQFLGWVKSQVSGRTRSLDRRRPHLGAVLNEFCMVQCFSRSLQNIYIIDRKPTVSPWVPSQCHWSVV